MPANDKINKRATFGTFYPSDDVIFEESDKNDNYEKKSDEIKGNGEKRFIISKRLTFNVQNTTFRKKVFQKSMFHNKHGIETPIIKSISFEDCDFKYTFLGGTNYQKVNFRRCSFERCDFMNAVFDNCTFVNCHFHNCTAYSILLNNTEIDPKLFYKSISIPKYNFHGLTNDQQLTIKREWIGVRLHLARQLAKSSNEISNTKYYDDSIFLLKCAELSSLLDSCYYTQEKLKDKFGTPTSIVIKIFYKICYFFEWLTKGAVLICTKGGTSIFRLLFILFIVSSYISNDILYRRLCYNNIDLHFEKLKNLNYIQQYLHNLPYSVALFLGFGYGGFEFEHQDSYILTLYTILGLIWYSLLGTVIIRKIYK